MNQADGRWTVKVPAETRAAILAQAHAADLTVAEWLEAAVRADRMAAPAPTYVGELELVPGLLVRCRAGGPVMCAIRPEVVARSSYAGLSPEFSEGGPTGDWYCEWFVRGAPHSRAFSPIALELAA